MCPPRRFTPSAITTASLHQPAGFRGATSKQVARSIRREHGVSQAAKRALEHFQIAGARTDDECAFDSDDEVFGARPGLCSGQSGFKTDALDRVDPHGKRALQRAAKRLAVDARAEPFEETRFPTAVIKRIDGVEHRTDLVC